MAREQVSIKTADGNCPATVFTPGGAGPWPGAILYLDGLAIRPSLQDMGERLSNAGYAVLLPDLFYRAGPYAPMNPKEVFAMPDFRSALAKYFGSTDNRRAAADTAHFIAYLDARADVARGRIGTVGYCMGGGMALTVAGTYPDRIGAAASFHGGNLASDSELSPHLLAPKMRARVYIGIADKDHGYPPDMAARMDKALMEAGVAFISEFYPGARHGWTQTDFPVYDHAAAEQHWRRLIGLFDESLKG